jgi:hypothetical protein
MFIKVVWNCYGILAIVKTITFHFLANKNHTLAGFLVLLVPKIASSKVVITENISCYFWHLQKQCKHYRFMRCVDKTIVKFLWK